MFSRENSKRLYYLTIFIGPILYYSYLKEIIHWINVAFRKINLTIYEALHEVDVFFLRFELTLFIIQVVLFYSFIMFLVFRLNVLITPVTNKLIIVLSYELKCIVDTFSKKNIELIYFIYYFISLASPTFIFCYFFQDEIFEELKVFFFDLQTSFVYFYYSFELTLSIIRVVLVYLFIVFLLLKLKMLITPIVNKFKIILLHELKCLIDTFSKENRKFIYLAYYFISVTSPISIFCYFFQDEISRELEVLFSYLQVIFFYLFYFLGF